MRVTNCLVPFALAGLLAFPAIARADDQEPVPPTGKGAQDAATSGSTDVGGGDEFQTVQDVGTEDEEAEESLDATEFDLSAGGILSTGNSRNLALTSAANFRIRRGIHQFGSIGAGNYGVAAAGKDADWKETTNNVQGLVRYDVFFAKRWSAFTQVTARHDLFQGLRYRMNVDPGVAFYAINKAKHRLWFEGGYDFQYDLRSDEAIVVRDDAGNPVVDAEGNVSRLDRTFINHAARLYVGYSNRLSDKVTFDTSLEYLQSFIDAKIFRLNYNAALSTQIAERFSLATTFTLRYENDPLPDVQKLDTITAINLVYRFF